MVQDSRLVALAKARKTLDRISQDLRMASQKTLVCGPNLLQFSRLDPTGGPTVGIKYQRNDTGTLTVGGEVLATGVADFMPTCPGGGLVRIAVGVNDGLSLVSQVRVQNP